MPYLSSFPSDASLLNVFKRFPETSRPLLELHEALLRGPSPFSEAERELIAAYVSGLNKCRYCKAVHTATAELLGVTPGSADLALNDIELGSIAEKMKPILRYALKLPNQLDSVDQADADAIFAAGWDETALDHTVSVTALFNFMNRLVEGLGIELDAAYVTPASERLARGGYLPLLELIKR